MSAALIVRVVRPDGSVHFRGARLTPARAEREAQAWRDVGQTATVERVDDVRVELRAWERAASERRAARR